MLIPGAPRLTKEFVMKLLADDGQGFMQCKQDESFLSLKRVENPNQARFSDKNDSSFIKDITMGLHLNQRSYFTSACINECRLPAL